MNHERYNTLVFSSFVVSGRTTGHTAHISPYMLDSIKLKLKKWIGSFIGYWCPVCGSPTEDIGYNFKTRCSNPDCSTRLDPKRFDIPNDILPATKEAEKHMEEVHKKRGRPKKNIQ